MTTFIKHASWQELMALRDGCESPVSDHVHRCSQCQTNLEELNNLGATLFAAVDDAVPDGSWARIQSQLQSNVEPNAKVQKSRNSNSLSGAIYALAASIAFVGVVAVFMLDQPSEQQNNYQELQASINELMAHSRGLELVVQDVAQQNQQLSAVSQASIERLEWRLSYLDQLILEIEPRRTEQPQRIQALWNERVETLNELNDLYDQAVINPTNNRW